jgi:uncharacterized protein (DUF111 family)
VLASPADAGRLELLLLGETTTLGVRRSDVSRKVLPRRQADVEVLGHAVRVKIASLPDGTERAKPEFDDVQRAALATGRRPADIFQLALAAVERRSTEQATRSAAGGAHRPATTHSGDN